MKKSCGSGTTTLLNGATGPVGKVGNKGVTGDPGSDGNDVYTSVINTCWIPAVVITRMGNSAIGDPFFQIASMNIALIPGEYIFDYSSYLDFGYDYQFPLRPQRVYFCMYIVDQFDNILQTLTCTYRQQNLNFVFPRIIKISSPKIVVTSNCYLKLHVMRDNHPTAQESHLVYQLTNQNIRAIKVT